MSRRESEADASVAEAFEVNGAALSRCGAESVFDQMRRRPKLSRSSSFPRHGKLSFKDLAVPGGFRKDYVVQKRLLARVCLDDLARRIKVPVSALIQSLQRPQAAAVNPSPAKRSSQDIFVSGSVVNPAPAGRGRHASCEGISVVNPTRLYTETLRGSDAPPSEPRISGRNSETSSRHGGDSFGITSRLLPPSPADSGRRPSRLMGAPLMAINEQSSATFATARSSASDPDSISIRTPDTKSNVAVFVRDDTTTSVAVFPANNNNHNSTSSKRVSFGRDIVSSVVMYDDGGREGEDGGMKLRITLALPVIAWFALVTAAACAAVVIILIPQLPVPPAQYATDLPPGDSLPSLAVALTGAAWVAQAIFVEVAIVCIGLRVLRTRGVTPKVPDNGPLRQLVFLCVIFLVAEGLMVVAASRITAVQSGLMWTLPPLYIIVYRMALTDDALRSEIIGTAVTLLGALTTVVSAGPDGVMMSVDVAGFVESVGYSLCFAMGCHVLRDVRCYYAVHRILIAMSTSTCIAMVVVAIIVKGGVDDSLVQWYKEPMVWGIAGLFSMFLFCACVSATFLDPFTMTIGLSVVTALCRGLEGLPGKWNLVESGSVWQVACGIIGCLAVTLGAVIGAKSSAEERSRINVRIQPANGLVTNTVGALLSASPTTRRPSGSAPLAAVDTEARRPNTPKGRGRSLSRSGSVGGAVGGKNAAPKPSDGKPVFHLRTLEKSPKGAWNA